MALGESVDLRSSNKQHRWKRFVSSTILLTFVACLLPIPILPTKSFITSTSQEDETPYPCEGGHCGCDSARKCWTSCCCTTPAEREIWAMQRGITPPTFAVRPKAANIELQWLFSTVNPSVPYGSNSSKTNDATNSTNERQNSCCQPKVTTDCCATSGSKSLKNSDQALTENHSSSAKSQVAANKKCNPLAACSTTECAGHSDTPPASSSKEKRVKHPIKYWLGISAAKCQGMNWDFLQVSWMPDEFPEVVFPLFSCFYRSVGPFLVCAHDLPPDPPPPKAHAPLDRTI